MVRTIWRAALLVLPLGSTQQQGQLRGASAGTRDTHNHSSDVEFDLSEDNGSSLVSMSSRTVAPSHIAYGPDPSYCLSSDWNRVGNGVRIQLWKCDLSWQSNGQNFLVTRDGRIRAWKDPNYCVVIDNDRYADGAQIQFWRCSEKNEHQTWRWYTPGQPQIKSKSWPEMCLVIDANLPRNGAKIQLWRCAHGTAQNWVHLHMAPDRQVAYVLPSLNTACQYPFSPVDTSSASCAKAASVLRAPAWGPWQDTMKDVSKPQWPRGCFFLEPCEDFPGIQFNPVGHTDAQRNFPGQSCESIQVVCQMPIV